MWLSLCVAGFGDYLESGCGRDKKSRRVGQFSRFSTMKRKSRQNESLLRACRRWFSGVVGRKDEGASSATSCIEAWPKCRRDLRLDNERGGEDKSGLCCEQAVVCSLLVSGGKRRMLH